MIFTAPRKEVLLTTIDFCKSLIGGGVWLTTIDTDLFWSSERSVVDHHRPQ